MEDCVSMKLKIVGSVLARFVASAETVEVWSHDATGKGMLRVGGVVQEHGDHLAVEIGQRKTSEPSPALVRSSM